MTDMEKLIERLESLRRQILNMTASGNDYGLSEAIVVLRAQAQAQAEPVAVKARTFGDWRPIRTAIEAAYRDLSIPLPESGIPDRDWTVIGTAIQNFEAAAKPSCIECRKSIEWREAIRCLDCKMTLCETCAPRHFWPNGRSPALTAAAPYLAAPKWRPMDSAPKDGTRFLAYTIEDGVDFFHWQGPRRDDAPVGWRNGFIRVFPIDAPDGPRGWMPLPVLPTAPGGEDVA